MMQGMQCATAADAVQYAAAANKEAEKYANYSTMLAQWVQYLWAVVGEMTQKITELEDWKQRTMEDVRKLRDEHKKLRKQVFTDDLFLDITAAENGLTKKARALPTPLSLAEHVGQDAHVDADFGKKPLLLPIDSVSSPALTSPSVLSPPPPMPPPPPGMLTPGTPLSTPAAMLGISAPLRPPPGLGIAEPEALMASVAAKPAASPAALGADEVDLLAPFDQDLLEKGEELVRMLSESEPVGEGALEGVKVESCAMTKEGGMCEKAEWRIGHLSMKLRSCMGRALVSSPFKACGLDEIRLMIYTEGKHTAKGPRSRRQKELYAKKVSDGPLDGCLKLKVPSCPVARDLEYFMIVGKKRFGPFKHNFAECTVAGDWEDFDGLNWLDEVDPLDHSLTVGVEMLNPRVPVC